MSKITKFSYNNQTQSFTDRETLECDCCIVAGTPEWKGKTGWIVIHNSNSGNSSDMAVIKWGATSNTGGNYYIGSKGDIYLVHDPGTKSVSHCGTSYGAFFPNYNGTSNDLLDKSISEVIKSTPSKNDQNFNFFSVGIECITNGFGDINDSQKRALAYVCSTLQEKYPELRKGGITCHGNVMPNVRTKDSQGNWTTMWGEKKACGRVILNNFNGFKGLTFANFNPTPSDEKTATEKALNGDSIRDMISKKYYDNAQAAIDGIDKKYKSIKDSLQNDLNKARGENPRPEIQADKSSIDRRKKDLDFKTSNKTEDNESTEFNESDFQEIYDSSNRLR